MASDTDSALTVRAAYKRFPSQVVLRGLDMTVPHGSIYTLLGPSGCGKTTLFKCIVGMQYLDSGEIFVKSNEKCKIGYMPQELALHRELTIKETFVYYGLLYNMSLEDIDRKSQDLVHFLGLPPPDRTLSQLSGGQQRRVSFSVALLHSPEFLILDEPTVGLDPLICQEIWKHLLYLTAVENKSVLITTHYIEEARQAHMVGLMREGVLLAEKSPQALMDAHHCDSLEQVFLDLSQKQSISETFKDGQNPPDSQLRKNNKPPLSESNKVTYHRIKAQNQKNFYWIWRNTQMMVFIYSLTVLELILYNVCFGHTPKGIRLGYVNEELSNNNTTSCSSVQSRGCNLDSHLSCRFLNTLEHKNVALTEFKTLDDGVKAVQKNDIWGLLYFSGNYTITYGQILDNPSKTSEEVLDLSEVKIWLDMSDVFIGTILKRDIYNAFSEHQQSLYQDCGWPPAVARLPVVFNDAIYGSNTPDLTVYSNPLVIALVQFFNPVLYTTGALLAEKKEGVLERNIVAGLNIVELLISHCYIQFLLLLVHTGLVMLLNFVVFLNPMVGSWLLYIYLLMAIGICGLGCGIFLSALCNTDNEATVLGMGLFIFLTLISGLIWPVEGIHYLLQPVSKMMPLTKTTEAYRSISFRGWSILHPAVYTGFFTCGLWIVGFLLASAAIVRWKGVC